MTRNPSGDRRKLPHDGDHSGRKPRESPPPTNGNSPSFRYSEVKVRHLLHVQVALSLSPVPARRFSYSTFAPSGKHARTTAASRRFGTGGRKLPRLPKPSTPRAERCTPSSCHPPGETRAYGESGSHGVQLTLVPPFHRIAVAMSPRRGNGYRIRRPPTLRIALTLWRLP